MIPPDHPFLQGRYGDLDRYDLDDPLDLALALRGQSAMDLPKFRNNRTFQDSTLPKAPDLREAVRFQRWIDGADAPYIPPLGSVGSLPNEALAELMDGNDELVAHDASWAYMRSDDSEDLLVLLDGSRYRETSWSRTLSASIELFSEHITPEDMIEELIGLGHHDACVVVVGYMTIREDPRTNETRARALTLHPTHPRTEPVRIPSRTGGEAPIIGSNHSFLQGRYDLNDPMDLLLAIRGQTTMDTE